jgi:hypothetical protein
MDFYFFLDESDEEINEQVKEEVKVPKKNFIKKLVSLFSKKNKN